MAEIFVEGVRYVSIDEAAQIANRTRPYLMRLCRAGHIRSTKSRSQWYVDAGQLTEFISTREMLRAQQYELLAFKRAEEYRSHNPEAGVEPINNSPDIGAYRRTPVRTFVRFAAVALCLVLILGIASERVSVAHSPSAAQSAAVGSSGFLGALAHVWGGIASIFAPRDAQPMIVAAPATSTPQTIVNNTYNTTNNTTNNYTTTKVVSAPTAPAPSGVSEADVDKKLSALSSTIHAEIYRIGGLPASGGISNNVALSQRIDRLASATIENSDWTGGTISNAKIVGSTFSGALSVDELNASTSTLATTTVNGDLTVTGDFNFGGSLALTNTTFTNATSTTFSSDSFTSANATSTTLYTTLLNAGTSTIAALTVTDATSTSLYAQVASLGSLSLSTALDTSSGGTGTSTAPLYGQLLMGNGSGGYDLIATSSLGIVGGGGGASVAGNTGEIQFNDFGSLGASSAFTLSTTTGVLSFTSGSTSALTVGGTATTTNLSITGIASSLLKTNALGQVSAAAAGTDYLAPAALDSYLSLSSWFATTTDALAEGVTNKYYADARVNSFVSGSSTIAKTYAANTFTGPQTFAQIITGDISGNAATETDGVYTTTYGPLFYAYFHATTTDALAEGSSNLYFTNDRVASVIAATTTSALAEGSNLYYTQGRFDAALAGKSTSDLTEGSNLYFTNDRVGAVIAGTTTDALAEGGTNKYYSTLLFSGDLAATSTDALREGGTNLYFTNNRVAAVIAGTTTSALAEGSNLYFTDSRADARINATSTIATLLSAPNLSTVATSLSGILKASSGALTAAVAGTDYENPITFSYPLTRASNAISLAFGTTTSNTWSGTQTFTNAPVFASFTGLIGAHNGASYAVSTSSLDANITGNAGTATALQTSRAINGISFDGTSDITITAASSTLLADNNTFSGNTIFSSLLNLSNGFLSSASSTIGNGTQAGGLTVSGGATTTGDAYIGGSLLVGGSNITLGTSTSNLLVVNSAIGSNVVPSGNKIYDLGSPAFFWRNAYVDTLNVNNLSVASSSIGGTASETFTINSDNASADAEDMNLVFYRGTVVPNAVLSWNSAADKKRFEFNQPLYIENQSGSTTEPTLTLKGLAGQTANILTIASSSGSTLFSIASDGSTSVGGSLTVNGSLTSAQLASTSQLSVFQKAYFGSTATSTFDSSGNLALVSNGLTVGTNQLVVSGGDVGIQTAANPLYDVDLGGNVHVVNNLTVGNNVTAKSYTNNIDSRGLWFTSSHIILGSNSATAGANPFDASFNGDTILAPLRNDSNNLGDVAIQAGGIERARFKAGVSGGAGLGTLGGAIDAALVVNADNGSTNTAIFKVASSTASATTTLFVINNQGNVGVGTSTPWGRLSILTPDNASNPQFIVASSSATSFIVDAKGNAGIGGSAQSDGSTRTLTLSGGLGGEIFFATNGTVEGNIWSDQFGTNIWSQQATPLTFGTDNSERGRFDSSGNFGIGTTSPNYLLTLAGTSGAVARFDSTSANGGGLTLSSNSSNYGFVGPTKWTLASGGNLSDFGFDALNNLVFSTAEGERMRINSSGKVGIGTTNPSNLLSISGAGTAAVMSILSTGNAPSALANNMTGINLITGDSNVGNYSGAIKFMSDDATFSTENPKWLAGIVGRATETYNSNTTGGMALDFLTAPNGVGATSIPSTRMTIDQGGNVGIGTTTPNTALDVNGMIRTEGTGRTTGLLLQQNTLLPGSFANIFADSSDNLNIQTWASKPLVINASGNNVGISTSTPAVPLFVQGSVSYNGNRATLALDSGAASAPTSILFDHAGAIKWNLSSRGSTDTPNDRLSLYGAGGTTEVLSVLQSGNVGIGTTSPSNTLEVNGPAFVRGILQTEGSSGGLRLYDRTTGDAKFSTFYRAGDSTRLWDNAVGDVLSYNTVGNVGIGTTSPQTRLHVASGFSGAFPYSGGTQGTFESSSNSFISLLAPNANTTGVIFGNPSSNIAGGIYYNDVASNGLDFRANGNSTKMVITSSGSVGIGQTAPDYTLEVNGTIGLSGSQGTGFKSYLSHSVSSPYDIAEFNSLGGTGGWSGAFDFKTSSSGGGLTSRLRINGDTGNVGIATTSPYATLSIADSGLSGVTSLAINNRFRFRGDGVLSWGSNADVGVLTWDATHAIMGAQSGKSLQLESNGIAQVTLDTSGNLGIGNTTPSNPLTVGGDGQSNALIVARNSGLPADDIEFGHTNTAGYASTLGHLNGSGNSYLCFHCMSGSTSNTFKTLGFKGSIMMGDRLGGFSWGTTASASADSQTMTTYATLSSAGALNVASCTGCSSDQRLKTNIVALASSTDALGDLMKLRPVSFNWKGVGIGGLQYSTTTIQYGFIAQEAQQAFPDLVYKDPDTSPYTPDGTYLFNYQGLISPLVLAVQEIAQLSDTFRHTLIAWLGDAANGIGDFFANRVHTKELCVAKSDGSEVCITGDQLAMMMAGQSASAAAPSTAPVPSESTATTTAPVIEIQGNNPAEISVGSAYTDLGAIITGPTETDTHLGITTYVDGVTASTVTIGTSAAGTHTIDYVASNSFGTATSTRTVNVTAPQPVIVDTASSTPDVSSSDATSTPQLALDASSTPPVNDAGSSETATDTATTITQ